MTLLSSTYIRFDNVFFFFTVHFRVFRWTLFTAEWWKTGYFWIPIGPLSYSWILGQRLRISSMRGVGLSVRVCLGNWWSTIVRVSFVIRIGAVIRFTVRILFIFSWWRGSTNKKGHDFTISDRKTLNLEFTKFGDTTWSRVGECQLLACHLIYS